MSSAPYRAAAATAIAAWGGRFAFAACQLLALRLVTDALSTEEYAVYALVAALQGWYLLCDLGTGSSLQNHVSERLARGEDPEPAIRAGVQVVLATAAAAVVLTAVLSPLVARAYLRRLDGVPQGTRTLALAVGGALLAGAMVAQVAQQLWYARRRGWIAIAVLTAAQVAAVALLALVRAAAPARPLPWALAAALAPPAAAGLGLLLAGAPESLPRLGVVDRETLRAVLARGGAFFGFALLASIVLQVDAVVLSQLGAPGQIATYAVVFRVYALPLTLLGAALTAIWPTLAELHAAGRSAEAARLVRRVVGAGAAVLTVLLVPIGAALPWIVRILAPGAAVEIPAGLAAAFSAYVLVRLWTDGWGTMLQSMSALRPLYTLVPVQAALAVGLEVLLLPRFGLPGLVVGLALSFVLTVAWGLPIAVRRRLRSEP